MWNVPILGLLVGQSTCCLSLLSRHFGCPPFKQKVRAAAKGLCHVRGGSRICWGKGQGSYDFQIRRPRRENTSDSWWTFKIGSDPCGAAGRCSRALLYSLRFRRLHSNFIGTFSPHFWFIYFSIKPVKRDGSVAVQRTPHSYQGKFFFEMKPQQGYS